MNTPKTSEKPEQAIVIFQGGAALGAYECGAFEIIATEIDTNQEELAVIGGTSIGAFNAAIIARSYREQQRTGGARAVQAAQDLKTFWMTVLPNPSLPIFPGLQFPLAEVMQRSLNIWINVVLGNRHIFTPNLFALSPFATAHYSSKAAEKTLQEHFGTYEGSHPRLIVTATHVERGVLSAFDSGKKPITPQMLVACGSVPGVVPAKEIDGEYYWDGGLWSNTPLGAIMNAISDSTYSEQMRAEDTLPTYKVYIVNDHPQQAPLPQDSIGVFERSVDILLGDKSVYDIKLSERLNKYIEFVQFLKQYADVLPPEVQERVSLAYQEITEEKRWAILKFVQLRRGGLPYDYWSSTGDFSLSRIKELMDQGKRETLQQLEDRKLLPERSVRLPQVLRVEEEPQRLRPWD